MAEVKRFDLGPKNLKSGTGIRLSAANFAAVQRYVVFGLQLPGTDEKFRIALTMPSGEPIGEFGDLRDGYAAVNKHVTRWHVDTFPGVVDLAGDIVHYASRARAYYKPLLAALQAVEKNPDDAKARKKFDDVTKRLAGEAKKLRDRADKGARGIREFLTESIGDKKIVEELSTRYESRFGSQSAEIAQLNKEIEAARNDLEYWTREYEHATVVAATTPTYVWVFPVGTIAAAVVAGVYSDRAVSALNKMRNARELIERSTAALGRALRVMSWLGLARHGLASLCEHLTAALPVIEEMAGAWGTIASDLENLRSIVAEDVAAVGEDAVTLALDEWQNVSDAANEYRVHAYVTVEGTLTPLPKRAA